MLRGARTAQPGNSTTTLPQKILLPPHFLRTFSARPPHLQSSTTPGSERAAEYRSQAAAGEGLDGPGSPLPADWHGETGGGGLQVLEQLQLFSSASVACR